MTEKRHRYKNPLIVEALCELWLTGGKDWDPTIFGPFYERVKDHFPKREAKERPSAFLPLWGYRTTRGTKAHSAEMYFRRQDDSALVQIGEGTLAVNVFPPYGGWDKMKHMVLECAQSYVEVSGEDKIRRFAVRYINRLERPAGELRLANVCGSSRYVPEALRESGSPISLSVCQSHGAGLTHRFALTFVPAGPKDSDAVLSFGFWSRRSLDTDSLDLDIECYGESQDGIHVEHLSQCLEDAHGQVVDLFESLISDYVRKLMEVE